MISKTGLIQIYTGEGKGKTTAAIGLAIRAIAQGLKVFYVSFHKDPKIYRNGEQKILKKLGVEVKCFARSHPFCRPKGRIKKTELSQQCLKGIDFVKKIFKQADFDLLILDEINICVIDGFLQEEIVRELMQEKPKDIELVLTGRGATKAMIKQADLVSYIKEAKHPYKKGLKARKGIEY